MLFSHPGQEFGDGPEALQAEEGQRAGVVVPVLVHGLVAFPCQCPGRQLKRLGPVFGEIFGPNLYNLPTLGQTQNVINVQSDSWSVHMY